MTTETWRPVVGFEGWYEVSSSGRLRRTQRGPATQPGRIVAGEVTWRGYVRIQLCRNGTKKRRMLHQLVLEAFVGPPDGRQVNHKNGIKADNSVDNLEWTTCQENIRHAVSVLGRTSPKGELRSDAKLTEEGVRKLRAAMDSGVPNRVNLLSQQLGVSRATGWNAAKRKTWRHVQ